MDIIERPGASASGEELAAWRDAHGVTQSEVARLLGVTQENVSIFETRTRRRPIRAGRIDAYVSAVRAIVRHRERMTERGLAKLATMPRETARVSVLRAVAGSDYVTSAGIAEKTGLNVLVVRNQLVKLKKDGIVERDTGSWRWRVVAGVAIADPTGIGGVQVVETDPAGAER